MRPAQRWLGIVVVAGCLLASVAAAPAVGGVNPAGTASSAAPAASIEPYLYRPDGMAADPVNLLFVADTPRAVADALARALAWPAVEGGEMDFGVNGGRIPTGGQVGLDHDAWSRLHLRYAAAVSAGTPPILAAAVHRDDSRRCGHVGRNFDETRDLVAQALAGAGYPVTYVWLGNVAPGAHCDTTRPTSDGYAALVDLSPATISLP